MSGILQRIHPITRSVTRTLRGETVTLRDSAGATLDEITDAIVRLDPPIVTRDSGPAERTGTVRLKEAYHANAVLGHTIIVRGDTFDVLSVGLIYAGEFTVIIGVQEDDHPNITDINGVQAVWSDP